MDLMEYSDFCGAGDAGDAGVVAGHRPSGPSVRPRLPPPRTPEGLSPPSSLSLSQTSNLSVIFSFSNPGQYGQGRGRERPMQRN